MNDFELTKLGSLPRHLEQTENHVLLILAHDQVISLEEKALKDTERAPAPRDEVGYVVAREEGARARSGQVGYGGRRGPACREAAGGAPAAMLEGGRAHIVGVLEIIKVIC